MCRFILHAAERGLQWALTPVINTAGRVAHEATVRGLADGGATPENCSSQPQRLAALRGGAVIALINYRPSGGGHSAPDLGLRIPFG